MTQMPFSQHYTILFLREHPEWAERAAAFFAPHWNDPIDEFRADIAHCTAFPNDLPQYYIVVQEDRIIGGIGVCVNDDHDRPDLTPNICDLWIEPEFRGKGIAGQLLSTAEKDMLNRGIHTLYLVTEHTSFYFLYCWSFVTNVSWKYADRTHSRMYKKE